MRNIEKSGGLEQGWSTTQANSGDESEKNMKKTIDVYKSNVLRFKLFNYFKAV